MPDYIKKYQEGKKLSPYDTHLSDRYIKEDLAHIDVKVKDIMGGLSREVFDGFTKSNLLELDKTVGNIEKELKARAKGTPGSKYKDYSDEKLNDHYTKLNALRDKTIKDKTIGYTSHVLKYLESQKAVIENNPNYTASDKMALQKFFDTRAREINSFANSVYDKSTIDNIQKYMKEKQIGYGSDVLLPLDKYKNGGKLVPKFQGGKSTSMLANDRSVLDMLRDSGTFGDYGNYKPYSFKDYNKYAGYQGGDGQNYGPYKYPAGNRYGTQTGPEGAEGYVGEDLGSSEDVKNLGTDIPYNGVSANPYVNEGDVAYKTFTPIPALPNFTLKTDGIPSTGFGSVNNSFGNQEDQSFSKAKTNWDLPSYEPKVAKEVYTPKTARTLQDRLSGAGPLVTRTGLFGGSVQWNDIAQYLLARKAHDRPVDIAPVHQESFQGRGSRNVQSISGIDSSIRNKVAGDIAAIGGNGYQGSDPVMNMIVNSRISNEKRKAKLGWATQEADHLRNEKARFAQESEQKRGQIGEDLVGANADKNLNSLAVTKGAHDTALAEQKRESLWLANKAKIFSDMQARWNENAKQRATARGVLHKEKTDRDYAINKNAADNAAMYSRQTEYYYPKKRLSYEESLRKSNEKLTEDQITNKLTAFDEAHKSKISEYAKTYKTNMDAMTAANNNSEEATLKYHDKATKDPLFPNFWGK